ncbi:MAG: Ig-like domain-containing protein [Gammaproteobacteria bacterium]|nr:Ig-like domain-containing protein [Gammaproteobacteria bacterium]
MLKLKRLLVLLIVGSLFACSSGGDDDSFVQIPVPDPVTDPTTPPVIAIASIEALTSNPQIQSDGGIPVTITALVKDANNNFVEGAAVSFAADSGGMEVLTGVTGTDGVATARLSTAGNRENRVISVTVSVTQGETTLTDVVSVTVIGTNLQITGPSSLAQGAAGTYTLVLNDADGAGINGETIAVASSLGNTLSATTLTTDSAGQAQVLYTAVNGGSDTLSATALGESASTTINVSDDSFIFATPAASTEVQLGATQTVTVRWTMNSAPVVGQSVAFASTRGAITPSSVVTNANGEATASVSATNAGAAIITATTVNGPSATLPIEFVAITPASIEVQADPFTVSPNSQSAITAIVRDPDGNLVKNVSVEFQLSDITGGTLSVPSAVTDSIGRAQTFYTSSSQTSSVNGVRITGLVASAPAINDAVLLTVAGREVFFTFGTGNSILEPNPAQYQVPYVVQVTDADGRPVTGVDVSMSVVSVKYIKGFWCPDNINDLWYVVVAERCDDEDVNRNGILDPGEDINSNLRIEAGNIATITPGSFTSDDNGFGFIDLYYPQEYGGFLEVEMQARASVQGTEFSEKSVFLVSVIADDVNSLDKSPPGLNTVPAGFVPQAACPPYANPDTISSSPFGYNPNCTVFDFPN